VPLEVFAVGASLGGLEALGQALARIPAAFPAALVVAQHRSSEGTEPFVPLLRLRAHLPVTEPDDKEPIRSGWVYVAPAGYHLLVERGFFSLSIDPPVLHARPSIDLLFESLADAYGSRAGCMILTGSSPDGARGAAAVKRAGGVVLVQDPTTAESPAAPRAVLEATPVDTVGSLDQIVDFMCRWCTDRPRPALRAPRSVQPRSS
jgi:two-component system, chemotaxis family, protein-glutamate methylesterase/glutaminase